MRRNADLESSLPTVRRFAGYPQVGTRGFPDPSCRRHALAVIGTHPASTAQAPAVQALAVSSDPRIVEHVLRVTAAVGCPIAVVDTAAEARRMWSAARVVLVGADLICALADMAPQHRAATVLVVVEAPDLAIIQAALRIGADDVVHLPADDAHLVARIAELSDGPVRRGAVLAIRGTAGGIGASTVAVGLAVTATRAGCRVLLIDGAVDGPGIDLLLGLESEPGMRWPDLADLTGRVNPQALDEAVPHGDGIAVLSWDRRAHSNLSEPALAAVLDAGARGYDLVLVDVAGLATAPGLQATLLSSVTASVLLVDDSVRSLVAASRLLSTPGAVVEPAHIVVRGGAAAADTVREVLGVPVLATVPDDPAVRRAARNGDSPITGRRSGLLGACRAILAPVLAGR